MAFRHLVATVLSLTLGRGLLADTVVLRDGSRREGKLRSCDLERCTLDGNRIALSAISRIELHKVIVPPSVPANSILQTDGGIVSGIFTGLNLGYVYLDDREIDRDFVAVIFIEAPRPPPPPAPAPVVQPSQPSAPAPPPPPVTQPSTPAPATPPSQPAPQQPPSQPRSRRTPPTGALWSGRIRGLGWGNVEDCRTRLNVDVVVRLREAVPGPLSAADGSIMGTATILDPTGSIARNRYRSVCPYVNATGSGTTTVTRNDVPGGPGVIFHNTRNTPRRTANGIDMQPGQQWYVLSVASDASPEYDITYTSGPNVTTSPIGFVFPVIGGPPILDPGPFADTNARYLEGGRMVGAYVTSGTGLIEKYALSWSICRQGVPCPPPPQLPEAAQQQRCPEEAVAEVCGNQLLSYLDELEPMQAEYARLMKLAQGFYPAYMSALRRCAAWKIVQTLLETILGAKTAELGQAGENAANALTFFKALIEGDPTAPLADALMSDAEAAFKPLEIANKVKGYIEKGNQIGDLLSKSGDLNSLRGATIDTCLGAVDPQIHLDAQKFVEYTRQAAEYYKNVFAPKMNDIDAKMRECADLESAAERACQ